MTTVFHAWLKSRFKKVDSTKSGEEYFNERKKPNLTLK